MVNKVIERIQGYFPPDKDWKCQRQTEPPAFGWARRVSEKVLAQEVLRRRPSCEEILRNGHKFCDYTDNKIALIVLSCRRWPMLERLVESLKPFFAGVETYQPLERILVDNGSGEGLVDKARTLKFFDRIVAHPQNLGMVGALRDVFRKTDAEYILLLEDDFVLEYERPFLERCKRLFQEYPEIGIIRLKNQNNWWKPHRVIAPVRRTSDGTEFWTWLPSRDGMLNVWAAGSVLFRKVSYFSAGELPEIQGNLPRSQKLHQGYIYECVYGKKYNQQWLAAKIKDGCVFIQPNDDCASRGWGKE
jgi:hypothetical protein